MKPERREIIRAFKQACGVINEIYDHRARWAHLPRTLQHTRVMAVLFDVDPYWERFRLPHLYALFARPTRRR